MFKDKRKDIAALIGAVLVPLVLMLIVMWYENVWPMGEMSMLYSDMEIQYINFYNWFYDVLHGEASLFYDFSKSLGGNMYGSFAVRFSNPISLLIYFFPAERITEYIAISTLIKICLSGLFCQIYLMKRFENVSRWIELLLSVSYALMEYNVGLCVNIHFMDAIYTLPLVALGAYAYIKDKKNRLLCLSVGYAVFCNWYMAYAVCGFATFYYIYEKFLAVSQEKMDGQVKKKIKGQIKGQIKEQIKEFIKEYIIGFIKYMFWVGVGVWIGCITMLPSLRVTTRGKGSLDLSELLAGFSCNFFRPLNALLISSRADASDYEPAIYVGAVVIAILLLGFFDKRIGLRKRVASLVFIVFVFLSFSFAPLELMWGAFKAVYSFYFRYSFVFSFLLVAVAGQFYMDLSETRERIDIKAWILAVGIIGAGAAALYLTGLSAGTDDMAYLLYMAVVVTLFFMVGWFTLKRLCIAAYSVMTICLFAELIYNAQSAFKYYTISQSEYSNYVTEVGAVIDEILESDTSFYRLETTISEMDNRRGLKVPAASEGLTFNYNSITFYGSLYDSIVTTFLVRTGYCKKDAMIANYVGSNLIMDSILGVKYILSDDEYALLEKIGEFSCEVNDNVYVYRNNYALSFATKIVEKDVGGWWDDRFMTQDDILDAMLGYDVDVFCDVSAEYQGDGTWIVTALEDGPIYFYFGAGHDFTYIYIDGEVKQRYFDRFNKNVVYAGEYEAGETFEIKIANDDGCEKAHNLYIYTINTENYISAFTTLQENSISTDIMNDDYIKLTWTATDDEETVMLAVPYDRWWSVYVNGEKVSYTIAYDCFITVNVSAGENVIELRYIPPYFRIGIAFSLLGLSILIFTPVVMKIRNKKLKHG